MNRDDYPTEAANGTPHLTYYADGVSFVWSGDPDRPIQVCPGGYGEPVRYRLAFDRRSGGVPASWTLGWTLGTFKRTCDAWLAAQVNEPTFEDREAQAAYDDEWVGRRS